jgi:type IV pilus assembly protein PilC
MPNYRYSALNQKGRTVRGMVMADNELDLESRLKPLGLELVDAKETKEKKGSKYGTVKIKDMIVLCLHMEQLDKAGVPLHEALSDVRDSTDSSRLRAVLANVYEFVKNGSLLSTALAQFPKIFDSVFIGLIASAEKTGNLADAYKHLTHHMKWNNDLKRKIKKAVRYPCVLLIVISIVITVMMLAVVPKLVDFIVNQGFTLPWHTKLLIAVSGAFSDYWWLILGFPIISIIVLFALYKTSEKFAYFIDGVTLKLPIIGSVVRKIDMARFTHFFSVMYRSGIDILEALESSKKVVRNRVLKESLDYVKLSVSDGNSLTSSLKLSNQFPNLVIRMFKVGEDSGNINDAMENINFFYDREVNDAVDGLIGMIQPILTVIMGVMIFWIIAAVFGPLYQSFSKMKF